MRKLTPKNSACLLLLSCLVNCAESRPPRVRLSDAQPPNARTTLAAPDESTPDPAIGGIDADTAATADATPTRARLGDPGWLGVELAANHDAQVGVRILEVVRRSPAAAAGLETGDVIVRLEGNPVTEPVSFIRRIRASLPRQKVTLGVKRRDELREVSVQLEPAPTRDELLERRFVGAIAPSLDGIIVVSGDVEARWAALRGQLVLLEFWSPWCGVCQLMHQRLNEWQSQWAMHGVRVIGITALGPDAASSYATRLGMDYAVASDEAETTFRSYDVFAVPSLFLVDRRGIIVDASTGYSSRRLALLEKKLISLLGQGGTQ